MVRTRTRTTDSNLAKLCNRTSGSKTKDYYRWLSILVNEAKGLIRTSKGGVMEVPPRANGEKINNWLQDKRRDETNHI